MALSLQELVRHYDRPGPRYTGYPMPPVWSEGFPESQLAQALARADADPPPPLSNSPGPAPAPPSLYAGARSGILQCGGGPIPQNAEYVFRNLPPGKMQLDYDSRVWDARLVPGDGQTQKLILRNISSGPQKRCTVRWSVSP